MGLLLYKSDEMFSSTELIRKSKMIFNKILDKDIDKAIILRDGKPGFLLMDFYKYEQIMSEFEELKKELSKPSENKKQKKKKLKKKTKNKDYSDQITEIREEKVCSEIKQVSKKINSAHVIPPRPQVDVVVQSEDEDKFIDNNINQDEEQNIEHEEIEEISEEDEINNALKSIESMNFDPAMKAIAAQKIKDRIINARRERALKKENEERENRAALKEELEIQAHIKEENKKKEQELKEFWD